MVTLQKLSMNFTSVESITDVTLNHLGEKLITLSSLNEMTVIVDGTKITHDGA